MNLKQRHDESLRYLAFAQAALDNIEKIIRHNPKSVDFKQVSVVDKELRILLSDLFDYEEKMFNAVQKGELTDE